ncbi:hypothetical protein BVV10_18050 [Xanthomonas oryzae pv. oryzae]|nr:hypothetical protein BVV16_18015 [Xanthomonas oryzae pv. oryzae]AUI95285.1 hypothetical protein BVV17_18045 [Xanthomonas oryzae pv. oryzae]AUI98958.1 hypothetical protein BVV18_18045 [Xanthomonas oryzae pv. oryzae]AUJ02635.1 hypothetical protein BVV10_18050 [Xanthomonas oryzae pv. oryzae]AUJ06303.1 hypothetical protein BVV19_18080 [Xanthomonas oryzae pv. oryzae]
MLLKIGGTSRPLRLGMENLSQLQLPSILHWDLNHFVVLAKVGKGKVTILDPAIGERILSLDEVSRSFTGIGQSQDSSATHDLSAAISSSIASLGVFHPSV